MLIIKKMSESLKEKIISIVVTAAISALIALLQAVLAAYIQNGVPQADPEIAGGLGIALRTGYYIIKAHSWNSIS
jgi:hypothetical protein